LIRRPSRGTYVSSTQPDPPPSAYPIALNSARQRSIEPKSRARISLIAFVGWPSPPMLAK
jgi:hypothetical protein